MRKQGQEGGTSFIVAALALVIVLIGVAVFFVLQMFGGFRELQDATDAGNLNVAKEALSFPSNSIANPYQFDFSGLVDPTQLAMDLKTYNRTFGQALLVTLNAAADRPQAAISQGQDASQAPSAAGITNAQLEIEAATGGDGSHVGVGEALNSSFSQTANNTLQNRFSNVADSNSLRMLKGQLQNDTTAAAISYMYPGAPTNVYLDVSPSNYNSSANTATVLPITNDTGNNYSSGANSFTSAPATLPIPQALVQNTSNNQTSSAGYVYLPGYKNILAGLNHAPSATTLAGVPVFPRTQPHHVSGRDFHSQNVYTQNPQFPVAIVPPNAFKSVASAGTKKTIADAQTESYSLVGTASDYPASIPYGYLEIVNPQGLISPTYNAVNSAVQSELTTGIYLAETYNATSGSSGVAFSTNQGQLQAWQSFNNNPSGTAPPINDSNGNPYVFFSNQESASQFGSTVASIMPQKANGTFNAPCPNGGATFSTSSPDCETICTWTNISGSGANPTCSSLLPYFMAAYPTEFVANVPGGQQLTSVEYLKAQVIQHLFNGLEMFYGSSGLGGSGVTSAINSYWDNGYWNAGTQQRADALCGVIECPTTGNFTGSGSTFPGYTGLRYWNTSSSGGSYFSYDGVWQQTASSQQGYQVTHGGTASPVHQYQTAEISTAGTLSQIFSEIFNWPNNNGTITPKPNSVISQMAQRMHEIDPLGTPVSTAVSTLQNMPQTFDLGTTYYLYHNPTSSNWIISNGSTGYIYSGGSWSSGSPSLPPALVQAPVQGAASSADGSVQVWTSDLIGSVAGGIGGYQTQTTMVNPPHEADVGVVLYGEVNGTSTNDYSAWLGNSGSNYNFQISGSYMDNSPYYYQRGVDVLVWQPSSGYSNLLGVLTFENYCGGQYVYSGNASTVGAYGASYYCEPN